MKNKLSVLNIVLLAVAAVGLILAIVGIAIPWFTAEVTLLGKTGTENYGLFAEKLDGDFPIACVQTFAIISLIFVVAACAVLAVNTLGFFKVKWLYRVICAAVVLLFAVLTFIFALVFAGQYGSSGNALASGSFVASAGAYLLLVGAIAASVPLFFGKE